MQDRTTKEDKRRCFKLWAAKVVLEEVRDNLPRGTGFVAVEASYSDYNNIPGLVSRQQYTKLYLPKTTEHEKYPLKDPDLADTAFLIISIAHFVIFRPFSATTSLSFSVQTCVVEAFVGEIYK